MVDSGLTRGWRARAERRGRGARASEGMAETAWGGSSPSPVSRPCQDQTRVSPLLISLVDGGKHTIPRFTFGLAARRNNPARRHTTSFAFMTVSRAALRAAFLARYRSGQAHRTRRAPRRAGGGLVYPSLLSRAAASLPPLPAMSSGPPPGSSSGSAPSYLLRVWREEQPARLEPVPLSPPPAISSPSPRTLAASSTPPPLALLSSAPPHPLLPPHPWRLEQSARATSCVGSSRRSPHAERFALGERRERRRTTPTLRSQIDHTLCFYF